MLAQNSLEHAAHFEEALPQLPNRHLLLYKRGAKLLQPRSKAFVVGEIPEEPP